MESVIETRQVISAAAVFAATAVLVWFGNGLTPWWPLMWLAPLPLFWYSLRSSWWSAALVAIGAWLVGSASLMGYFRTVGMPFAAWLGNFAAMGCLAATGILLFRALMKRAAVWAAIIALPALWVSVDWLRYWITPHGTAADLAYTQLNFLPFLQLASVTGPWGMSFVLLLVPGAVAAAIHLREREPKQAKRLALASVALMLVILGFGTARLYQSGQPQTVRVGLIASDRPVGEDIASPGEGAKQLLSQYAAQARKLTSRGAKVIVMPEKIVFARDTDASMKSEILQSLADETGATIVAGELHSSADKLRYNRAEVYTPHAAVVSYDKEHLLPPFESDQTPGTAKLTLPRNGLQWGVAICKDMDFTSMSVAYAQLGTSLMLVPAWDFNQDRTWHGDMSIMRGVEGGFSIARAAKNGYLMVSDSRGRVIGRARSDSAPFATLIADVPVGHETTLFQLWRDWFAWVAVVLFAFVIIRVVTK
jgi:apolipoprotein N-acyltransferase